MSSEKKKSSFAYEIQTGFLPWCLVVKDSVGHLVVIMTMPSFITFWCLLFFLGKHGGGYWFIAGQKWVTSFFLFWQMVLFSTHNHCRIDTLFSLNNYTWLQAFLDFVFLLNKTVSGSLPLWYLVTLKWALRSWLESKLLCIVCSY